MDFSTHTSEKEAKHMEWRKINISRAKQHMSFLSESQANIVLLQSHKGKPSSQGLKIKQPRWRRGTEKLKEGHTPYALGHGLWYPRGREVLSLSCLLVGQEEL